MAKARVYGRWGINPGTPEDVTRCIESVTTTDRAAFTHQCWNKRGHGPGGLYCKQHARKHETATVLTIWACYIEYGDAYLEPVEVTHETETRWYIKDRPLVAHCKAFIEKSDRRFATTKAEAIDRLYEAAARQVDARTKELKAAEKLLKDVAAMKKARTQ